MMSIEQMAVAGRQPSIDRCESSRRRLANRKHATSEGGAVRVEAGGYSQVQSHPIERGGIIGHVVSRLLGYRSLSQANLPSDHGPAGTEEQPPRPAGRPNDAIASDAAPSASHLCAGVVGSVGALIR